MKYFDIKSMCYVILVIVLTSCAAFSTPPKEMSRSIDFQSDGTIEIVAHNGIVKVVGWDQSEVKVTAQAYDDPDHQPRADDALKATAINFRKSDEHLIVTVENSIYDSDEYSEGLLDGILAYTGNVKNPELVYQVHVPNESRCNVLVKKGAIQFVDVLGRVDATVDVGFINASISDNTENVLQTRGANCSLSAQYAAGRWVQF
jgi:hypothetical protein